MARRHFVAAHECLWVKLFLGGGEGGGLGGSWLPALLGGQDDSGDVVQREGCELRVLAEAEEVARVAEVHEVVAWIFDAYFADLRDGEVRVDDALVKGGAKADALVGRED